jgi:hypothetical protein
MMGRMDVSAELVNGAAAVPIGSYSHIIHHYQSLGIEMELTFFPRFNPASGSLLAVLGVESPDG